MRTRDIAWAAVRDELAQVALELIRSRGFDNVTITDLAAAAGVSRSTYLRYFAAKEDAVLGALDAQGEHLANALRARPAEEGDWTALRRALDVVIEPYHRDPVRALEMTRLVKGTPTLCSRHREKQHGWRPALAQALAERSGPPGQVGVEVLVRAAAALECLDIALERWTGSDGRLDLVDLLDESFASLRLL